ncbi:MAG: hypothetical protein RMJ37_01895 [Spirochaetia bacterium]|nr:hypothetical protein [Spirochaetota bacterium]MCX8096629.1 hypothetical protein [Spirochaetota bacterium]MDW8112076.1 hypothetical protein [Spirochaetia bacterium]
MWVKVLKEFFWLWWDNFSKNILVSLLGFFANIPTLFFTMGLFLFMRVPFEATPTQGEINLFWIVISTLFGTSIFFPTQIGLLTVAKNFSSGEHKKFFAEFFAGMKERIGKSLLGTVAGGLIYFFGTFAIVFYSNFFGLTNIFGIILTVITFWYLVTFTLFFVILSLYITFFPKDSIRTAISRSWVIMMDNVFVVFLTVLTIVPIFIFAFISAVGMALFYQGLVNSLLVAMFVVILRKYKIIEDVEDTRTLKDIFKPF